MMQYPDYPDGSVQVPLGSYDIQDGDLIAVDGSGNAVPSHEWDFDTDIATTQAAFAAAFVGVARSGDAASLSSAMVTVERFPSRKMLCTSATFDYGDYLAVAGNAGSTGLERAKLVKTATAAAAVGRSLTKGASLTSVKAEFESVVIPRGAIA